MQCLGSSSQLPHLGMAICCVVIRRVLKMYRWLMREGQREMEREVTGCSRVDVVSPLVSMPGIPVTRSVPVLSRHPSGYIRL